MELEKVMQDMSLSESEKDFIRNQNNNNDIEHKVQSLWQVIEDASGYG